MTRSALLPALILAAITAGLWGGLCSLLPRSAGQLRAAPLASRSEAATRRGRREVTLRRATHAAEASAQEPPGPFAVPFLGAPRVLWSLLTGRPLQDLLKELRAEYGPVFSFRAGPSCQVWVGDTTALKEIYNVRECAGRPVSFEDPFGNFLFLTREPEKAAPIREKQQQWLEENLQPEKVQDAVGVALEELWHEVGKGAEATQGWPTNAVKRAMYAAVTTTFLGKESLMSGEELEEFMAATKEYSEMRVKGKFGQKGGDDPGLPPGAAKIRSLLQAALARTGREDGEVALPLIVAASIGGAEIFPTLLHWITLSLAQDPERQEAAFVAASAGDSAALMQEIYGVLRRVAYSVALGPPRKILAEASAAGYRLPEGALLFALHPAISDEALGREPPADEDFSEYAFGVGPRACLGKPLAEALLPAAVGEMLRRFRVETSSSAQLRGELRGQLIHPLDPPQLLWRPRK